MDKDASDMDVERLLQYLSRPQLSPTERQWVNDQLRVQAIQEGLWSLGATIFPEALCRACELALPDYVHRQLVGEDVREYYPRLKAHLDHCTRCAQSYGELYQMVVKAYAGEGPVAHSYPTFDLSFLAQPEETLEPDWSQVWRKVVSAGRPVTRLFTEIRVLVSQDMASFGKFGKLPEPLAPESVIMPTAREKAVETEKQAQILPVFSPEHDLSISLTVGPVAGDQAMFGIQVTRLSSQQPLPRVRVTIRDQERRVLASERTNESGRATFARLGSGSYLVEIKRQGQTWELPLTFTWQE